MKLKVNSNKLSKQKKFADKILKDGIFEDIYERHERRHRTHDDEKLKEETEEDADKIKLDYKESTRNNWIEKFMKNNNYDMSNINSSSSDSLFISIIDAFLTIGKKTTISKLRSLISLHAQEMFDNDLTFKEQFEDNIQSLENQLKELKRVNKIYSKRLNNIVNFEDKKEMIGELKKLGTSFDNKKKQLRELLKIKEQEIGFMNNINTLEDYRAFIMTSKYWPDDWAIAVLEKQLNIKLIVLAENAYDEKIFNSILNTKTHDDMKKTGDGDDGDNGLDRNKIKNNNLLSCGKKNKIMNPEHYIILSSNYEKQYKLVSYKKKKIFVFSEIPYDIKILILNKCLEQNSGTYYLIEDFRYFKSLFGLDPDEGSPEDENDDYNYADKFDLTNNNIVFNFSNKCINSKPGQAAGEKIPHNKRIDFIELSKIKNWRCDLDDSTTRFPMTIDGHRWASVEHYVQACKFKKGFPDFYRSFSLDVPTELSKNPDVAKQTADLKKNKHKALRPTGVKIDVDYSLGRNLEEREKALFAKFSQNDDLKGTLKLTYPAILKHIERRKPPVVDDLLMKIRRNLYTE